VSFNANSFKNVSFNPVSFNGLALAPADQGGGWFDQRRQKQRGMFDPPLDPMRMAMLAYGAGAI
jgi:hypothetical protein